MEDKMISLAGAHSIVGRTLMVHEKADDLKTDPAGDAGARIGVGVVGIAKEE
jgi:Cu-Zn family superoxide dismutase